VQELTGGLKSVEAITPGAATTTNSPDARPRRAGGAGQDVEVKPGPAAEQNKSKSYKKDQDKEKKKNDGGSKLLRNP
jgi:hypothetical protein